LAVIPDEDRFNTMKRLEQKRRKENLLRGNKKKTCRGGKFEAVMVVLRDRERCTSFLRAASQLEIAKYERVANEMHEFEER
jgi:hypothetical protein